MKSPMNRRAFHATAAAAATTMSALSYSRIYGANDTVRIGFIGVGNRGDQLLDAFEATPNAIAAAVCDVNEAYLKHAQSKMTGMINRETDYRNILNNKEIQAVVIATPDHWHALQTIDAIQAGKHVYLEKPVSLTVAEGRAMVETAKKAADKLIVQVGFHRRSSNFCQEAVQLIQRGDIGEITMVRAFHTQNEFPYGIGQPSDDKEPDKKVFDWDAWTGPAPKRPYNENRAMYRFRWFYDYSGGQLTNMGSHYFDMIHWALGVDAPTSVAAMGGKLVVRDNREIPDTLEVIYQYPKTIVTFTQTNGNGAAGTSVSGADVEFRGTKGTLYLLGKSYVVLPEANYAVPYPALSPLDRSLLTKYRGSSKPNANPRQVKGNADTVWHTKNFIASILTKKAPNCPIDVGHRSTIPALLGNIALKQKAMLQWDSKTEQFVGNGSKEANAHLKYEYRAPYKFPTV